MCPSSLAWAEGCYGKGFFGRTLGCEEPLWGSGGLMEEVFWLLASKAPCYNGRGIEGVCPIPSSLGGTETALSDIQERDRKKTR